MMADQKPPYAPDPNMPFGKWLESMMNAMEEAGGDRAEVGLAVKTTEGLVPVVITVHVMTKAERERLAEIVRNHDKGKH